MTTTTPNVTIDTAATAEAKRKTEEALRNAEQKTATAFQKAGKKLGREVAEARVERRAFSRVGGRGRPPLH